MSKKRIRSGVLIKEWLLLILAVFSILLIVFEETLDSAHAYLKVIDYIDIVIALTFFIDFMHLFLTSKNRLIFIKHNWYILLACIPIATSWAEALRALRILRFIRILRAGEHLEIAMKK